MIATRAWRHGPDVRPSVLVVDDDPVTRRILGDSLGVWAEVREAATLAEAAACVDEQVRLVVTDLVLPDGGGDALLARVKRDHPRCLVYVMTAVEREDTEGAVFRAGADAFIRKPFAALVMAHRFRLLLEA